uniref:1-phosphatidylinositol 4,5-bisphosphate phosphodiesterase beta-1-like n=1 Tax=Seriola dumerili TaxID=41447 RepID=A0A3B4VER1_SERDU
MASAQPGVHALKLQTPSVSHTLRNGSNFIKWDEVRTLIFLKYLKTSNRSDTELLDLTLVKDVRTGRSTKTPKEAKLRELLDVGNLVGRLENRMVTVVTASDLVNVNQLNFIASQEDEAKVWCEELFSLSSNLLSHNLNRDRSLLKAIVRLFSSDRKKVENALENCRLPYGRVNTVCLIISNIKLNIPWIHDLKSLASSLWINTCKTHRLFQFLAFLFAVKAFIWGFLSRVTHSAWRGEMSSDIWVINF